MRTLLRLLVATLLLSALSLTTKRASAYAWMIRHTGNNLCATCHLDPSGGFLLNGYGHSEVTGSLSTFGRKNPKLGDTAFGIVKMPDWLLAGVSARTLIIRNKLGDAPAKTDFILMQADARLAVEVEHFVAFGSAGFIDNGRSPAAVISNDDMSIVSREHWLGYRFVDDKVLLRAGRITLPFGIRNIEHTQFVRQITRTDLNDTQQHGVSVNYSDGAIRAELMGIAGNFQAHPDKYRERGYSGYFEYTIADRYAVGVSSLVAHAKEDKRYRVSTTRMAHGAFVRISPIPLVAILGEVDWVNYNTDKSRSGVATMLQVDLEPVQGLHIIGTGETLSGNVGFGSGWSWSGWGGVAWFPFPHFDFRADYVHSNMVVGSEHIASDALLFQGHLYL